MPKITIIQDSVLKRSPAQSSDLATRDKMTIKADRDFYIVDHDLAEGNHLWVKFAPNAGWQEGYLYLPHVKGLEVSGNIENNNPNDPYSAKQIDGPTIVVPKLGEVPINGPIISGGNFTWSEATKGGNRIPVDQSVVDGIIKIAYTMEEVREILESPIRVNSWYRDPTTNRRVGGASRSRHLRGDAVDFVCIDGPTPHQARKKLDSWYGDRGGLASARTFTHIDARGYKARWRY